MKKGCLIALGVFAGISVALVVLIIGLMFKFASDQKKERTAAFNAARPEIIAKIENLLVSEDPSAAYDYASDYDGVDDKEFETLFNKAQTRYQKHQQLLAAQGRVRLYQSLSQVASAEGEMIDYDSDSAIEVSQVSYNGTELELKVTVKNDGIGKEFLPSLKLIDAEGKEYPESPNSRYVGFAPGLSTKSIKARFSVSPPHSSPLILVVAKGKAGVLLEPKEESN